MRQLKVHNDGHSGGFHGEYTRENVEQWVDNLPLTDIERTTRLVTAALHDFNKAPIHALDRYKLLEIYARPMATVLPHLIKYYGNETFPLPNSTRKFALLTTRMIWQYLVGYKRVLESEQASNWLVRKTQVHAWYTSAQRMMRCFAFLLKNHRLVHDGDPDRIWRAIHQLYLVCERDGWTDKPIPLCADNKVTSTIHDDYVHILLLSRIDLRHVTLKQFIEISGTWPEWTNPVRICKLADNYQKTPGALLINADNDAPPQPLNRFDPETLKENPNARVIDTHLLEARIRRYREQMRVSRDKSVHVSGIKLSEQTLNAIHAAWCQRPTRLEHRRNEKQLSVEITLGLVQTHNQTSTCAIKGSQPVLKSPSRFGLQLESEEMFTVRLGDHPDVWSRIYGLPAVEKRTLTPRQLEVETKPLVVKVVDQSRHGYRMKVEREQVERIRIGDVAAVRDSGSGQWKIGQIRWIRSDKQKEFFLIGIQLHMLEAFPATFIVLTNGRRSAPQPCIIGVDDHSPPLLILPQLPALRKKQLILVHELHETKIVLFDRVASTTHMNCYSFELEAQLHTDEHLLPHHPSLDNIKDALSGKDKHYKPWDGALSLVSDEEGESYLWNLLI